MPPVYAVIDARNHRLPEVQLRPSAAHHCNTAWFCLWPEACLCRDFRS